MTRFKISMTALRTSTVREVETHFFEVVRRVRKEWSGFDVSGRNHTVPSNVRFGVSCGAHGGGCSAAGIWEHIQL